MGTPTRGSGGEVLTASFRESLSVERLGMPGQGLQARIANGGPR